MRNISKPAAVEFAPYAAMYIDLLPEYQAVREATVAMFDGLPEEAFERSGVADGNPMSVRAAAYHIAGHEVHHLKIIRERYLAVST